MSKVYHAYSEHREALKAFLRRYFRREEDVEDAAQEAFLRAFKAEIHGAVRRPKSFLFQTAKNFALNEVTRKGHTDTDFLEDFEGSSVLQDETAVDADDRIASRHKLLLFVEAVAHLPPQRRRALLLRKVDGLKVKEVAETLNLSVSSVEKHTAAAILECAAYLADHGYDVGERRVGAVTKTSTKAAFVEIVEVRRNEGR